MPWREFKSPGLISYCGSGRHILRPQASTSKAFDPSFSFPPTCCHMRTLGKITTARWKSFPSKQINEFSYLHSRNRYECMLAAEVFKNLFFNILRKSLPSSHLGLIFRENKCHLQEIASQLYWLLTKSIKSNNQIFNPIWAWESISRMIYGCQIWEKEAYSSWWCQSFSWGTVFKRFFINLRLMLRAPFLEETGLMNKK